MTRSRSDNLVVSDETIQVANLRYLAAPMNPSFMAAFIGEPLTRPPKRRHPMKGWKLHVSASPQNAQEVADVVLPVLYRMQIWHKYVKSLNLLNRMASDRDQLGKFITVYTRDTDPAGPGDETAAVVRALQGGLATLKGPDVPNERRLAHMIYARYSYDYTKPGR